MKFQDIVNCLFPAIVGLLITALEHEKSFLIQDGASFVRSLAVYEDSILLTSSNDIVQRDILTGAIQRTFRAHKNSIFSFVITSDSRMITSAYDDMIIVWDLETGSILKRIWLRSADTLVSSLSFQDGQIFTGGLDGKVRQIDLVTGRVVKTTCNNSQTAITFVAIIAKVLCVVASVDSFYVGKDLPSYVSKLNSASGATILRLNGHTGAVFSLALYDDFLFSSSADSTIICWSTVSGEIIRKYIGHSGYVVAIAVFDGELYSSAYGMQVYKWNLNNGLITKKFTAAHESNVLTLAYKSKALFTGSMDTTVIKWNSVSGDALFRYAARNSKIRSVISWKNFIISAGDDVEIQMWDASIESLDPFAVIDKSLAKINILFIFEDFMYSGDNSDEVKLISLANLTLISILKAPNGGTVSFVADKLSLYGGGYFGSIYQWNISSGIQTALLNEHSDQVRSLQLIDDTLYSGSWDKTIKAWNTKSLESVNVFQGLYKINAMLIDRETLLLCTETSVEILSVISGETSVFLKELSACTCVVLRGTIVYTGHVDGLVRVRNLNSLISFDTYAGHLDAVISLCFDEVFNLYSAGFDGAVKKWNIASRRVAFSFENKNGSVSSLAAYQNKLLVGLKSGRIDCYDTDNAMSLRSLYYHSKAVSSLITFNDSIYSSGLDGAILMISIGDKNYTTVYKSNDKPLKDLFVSHFLWVTVQGDTKIIFSPVNLSFESIGVIEFRTPLVCVTATETIILAGSKLGIVYALGVETSQLQFELKGHVSPVHNLLVVVDRLFSASDDKTIIEWSLEEKAISKTYKRLSASALGHLGPVNSLSYCSETLFSAGSDLTVRRWNTKTGMHDDVYFGFSKSVTTVLCHNGSVFAGSEDFSVLMFKPNLPQNMGSAMTSTKSSASSTHQKRRIILKSSPSKESTSSIQQNLIPIIASILIVAIIAFSFMLYRKSRIRKESLNLPENSSALGETMSDLETVVNSIMGIAKHAAYLIENSVLAKIKSIAVGGGGELFLAKVMDSYLRKKCGEVVVQKIVFASNNTMGEAFYQEVGIMIMLNSFPHFCTIVGYTEKPLSIILQYDPDGSLFQWLRNNRYKLKIVPKIVKEISEALLVMHSHYLAHCDLKTQNVLVEVQKGVPSCFLTDFGITQVLSDKIIATKSFHVINLRGLSVSYAAPEAFKNFRSKSYTGADFKKYDIYSFACAIYEVLSRRSPWDEFH